MKKLFVGILVVLCLMFSNVAVSTVSADCSSAISAWSNQGWLVVNVDGDGAMAFIEILVWNKMTYNQKLGLATCIKKVYRTVDVYLFPLGGSVHDMLGRLKGSSDFKLYK